MASVKPPHVQAAVIAKKALGESTLGISRDLGIARGTVDSILESCNFAQMVQDGLIRVHRMIPKACDAFDHALEKNDVALATVILRNVGVLRTEEDSSKSSATVNFHCHVEEPIRTVVEVKPVDAQ